MNWVSTKNHKQGELRVIWLRDRFRPFFGPLTEGLPRAHLWITSAFVWKKDNSYKETNNSNKTSKKSIDEISWKAYRFRFFDHFFNNLVLQSFQKLFISNDQNVAFHCKWSNWNYGFLQKMRSVPRSFPAILEVISGLGLGAIWVRFYGFYLIFGRQVSIDSSSLSVAAHILNIGTLWIFSIETDSYFAMKMDNWFVNEFENIGFPSRVYIDTIGENINFGLFNSGWIFAAE